MSVNSCFTKFAQILLFERCNVMITFDMPAIMQERQIAPTHSRLEANVKFVRQLVSTPSRTGLVKVTHCLLSPLPCQR